MEDSSASLAQPATFEFRGAATVCDRGGDGTAQRWWRRTQALRLLRDTTEVATDHPQTELKNLAHPPLRRPAGTDRPRPGELGPAPTLSERSTRAFRKTEHRRVRGSALKRT